MEKITHSLVPHEWTSIQHASDIAAARRSGQRLAGDIKLNDVKCGELAIIITELATNMLKHANGGRLLLTQIHADNNVGIEALAMDEGPGISNLANALRDGVSSAGTAGTGLGAIRRLTTEFDAYTPPGNGSIFFCRIWRDAVSVDLPQFGAVCVPLASETECGDGWALSFQRRLITLMMADGLGHGPEAAKAAKEAIDTVAQQPGRRVTDQINACHLALRPTRGAALAVAVLDPVAQELVFAGVGNISACIVNDDQSKQLVSHNGIVGHNVRKVQEFTIPCPAYTLIIMHSDGVNTQWDLDKHPGLAHCHPAIIAALLLRDFSRGRDDATVLVLRTPAIA
ncbi:SpoIIE family protein phosphatase [Undibacterium sp. Ji42W]|uniref:SpoIIE family protein phosphatase n=1 Tax=Undibacterium sp. Ji42W TaxID=3413039 RepID=UPI003BF1F473